MMSDHKARLREAFDRLAARRRFWIERNAYFYDQDTRCMRFLVPAGMRVLEVGCGLGQLLAAVEPARGVGLDLSPEMVRLARLRYPHLEFHLGDVEDRAHLAALEGPFDVIILSDTLGLLEDCETAIANLQALCTPDTRLIIAHHCNLWEPALRLGEWLGLKMPQPQSNWLSAADISVMLHLADFETVRRDWRVLLPRRFFGLESLLNGVLAPLPLVRRFCLRHYTVARPLRREPAQEPSATVVIPCRNEQGNIEALVRRIPRFCKDLEVLFVEGGSTDGTLEEIERVAAAYPALGIKWLQQDGRGKGDAVRKGFAHARGEVLMILDADLTVPPEALPKFYRALVSGKGEFVYGTRLVYPVEKEAMRFLNRVANLAFSMLFSWLLNQRFTDTLCGTKAIYSRHYRRLEADRAYFGDFDPFGDFDLIFGAAKLNLKMIEIPVRYQARLYGETQIARFRHGLLLLRMVLFAYRKLKLSI